MKNILKVCALLCAVLYSSKAMSLELEDHKGFYLYSNVGLASAKHDKNVRTNLNFGDSYIPSVGLTLGYNFTNTLAPEFQLSYGNTVDNTASGNSSEHLATARLNLKYSFLTSTQFNQEPGWKIYPFIKAG